MPLRHIIKGASNRRYEMADWRPIINRRSDGFPRIMGILNITPDSFHADSRVDSVEDALSRARQMVEDGAEWLDIGGESTRPGAASVDHDEEMSRVLPVIEAIRVALPDVGISIDTRRASVARVALGLGANLVNDVSALSDPGMLELITETSTNLPPDVRQAMTESLQTESPTNQASQALNVIATNIDIASQNKGPICQDTGMPTFEIKTPVGTNQLSFKEDIRQAIVKATRLGKLRPNSVDSLTGENSGDNLGPGTPIIHFEQWENDKEIEVKLILKGGGCENKNIQEKKDTLINIGADLKLVPPKPYKDDGNFVKIAGRLAEELKSSNNNGVVWANQFDNTANAKGHYETTSPEIWDQTDGKIDGFVCSSGTGGTIGGVSSYLKEKNKNIKIYLSDPKGSALYNYIKNGELKSEGGSITERIGSSRVTANFAEAKIDGAFSISDQESLPILYDLIQNEGLSLGTSCGVNIAGAIRLGRELGPGKTIVTILCDKSDKYNSKMFNKKFLEEKGLPFPTWI